MNNSGLLLDAGFECAARKSLQFATLKITGNALNSNFGGSTLQERILR